MRRLSVVLMLLLAACDTLAPPTLTPTRPLTGPTLEPTGNAIPAPPSEIPGSYYDTFGSNDPTVAALPNDLDLPPLAVIDEDGVPTVEITLADRTLSGDLYAGVEGRAPGVLLLSEDRSGWAAFPNRLQESGYVVLSVEIAGAMTDADFRDILGSFSDFAQGESSHLDPSRIAVIGEQRGADVALRGCALDMRCDMVGLLSPSNTTGSSLALEQIGTRPLMVAASQTDPLSYSLAQTLGSTAQGDTLLQPFTDAGRGAEILQNRPDFAELVVAWLDRHLR